MKSESLHWGKPELDQTIERRFSQKQRDIDVVWKPDNVQQSVWVLSDEILMI